MFSLLGSSVEISRCACGKIYSMCSRRRTERVVPSHIKLFVVPALNESLKGAQNHLHERVHDEERQRRSNLMDEYSAEIFLASFKEFMLRYSKGTQ